MAYSALEDLWEGESIPFFEIPNIEDLDRNLTPSFMSMRVYRNNKNTENPRLYRLIGRYKYKEVGRKHLVFFESLHMAWVGDPTPERVYDVLVSEPGENQIISSLYDAALERHKAENNGEVKSSFPKNARSWFHKQWLAYEGSAPDVILATPPEDFSVKCNVPCLSYVNLKQALKHRNSDFVSWKNFMSQMDPEDAETFAAFVFSIFDEKSVSKQLMYLWDEGNTGKSTVTNAMKKVLGSTVCTSISKTLSTNDFGSSNIYGKRLIVYPECKDPDVLKSSVMHNITGGDDILINTKFQSMFSAKVYAKIIICSNDSPDVDVYQKNQKTRIIPLRLDSALCSSKEHYTSEGVFVGNPNFEKDLIKDFWAFVWYAFECYKKLCPTHGQIRVREDTFHRVVGENQIETEQIILDHFEITGEVQDVITLKDVNEILNEYYKFENKRRYLKRDFKRYVENLGVTWGSRTRVDGILSRVCTGIKKKKSSPFDGGCDVSGF